MDLVEEYIHASHMQQRDAKDLLNEFSEELSRFQGILLDIGCGPGNVTRNMLLPALPNVETIIAADISEAMVNHAEMNFFHEKITYSILNVETPELPREQKEKYFGIVSLNTLHWCFDLNLALANIHKMLKPGGLFLSNFICYHSGFKAYDKLKEYPQYEPYLKDAHRYVPYFQRIGDEHPEETLKDMLQNIGFKILHISKREKSYEFNRQSLKNHACAVNPFVKRLPNHMKHDFIDKLVNEILNQAVISEDKSNKNEDILKLTYCLLIAYVQKPNAIKRQ